MNRELDCRISTSFPQTYSQVSAVRCLEINLCQYVSLTCSQPLMMQQQRCPQGFGLIMVISCSLACRSRKNFLLRSVFFLHAKHQLCQTEAQATKTLHECTPNTDTYLRPFGKNTYLSELRDISLATL